MGMVHRCIAIVVGRGVVQGGVGEGQRGPPGFNLDTHCRVCLEFSVFYFTKLDFTIRSQGRDNVAFVL